MFVGILVGTLCLIGLVRAVTRRRWHGGPPWRRGGRGFLWSILARLDATPTQERAIIGAVDELKTTARELRGTMRETRGELARTIRGPSFDESAFQAAGTRVDDAARQMRAAVSAALGKVHGVLDDRQRKILGDMLDSGWAAGC